MRTFLPLLTSLIVSNLKLCLELSNHELERFLWPQSHLLVLQTLRTVDSHLQKHFLYFLTSSLMSRYVVVSAPLFDLVLPRRLLFLSLLLLKLIV